MISFYDGRKENCINVVGREIGKQNLFALTHHMLREAIWAFKRKGRKMLESLWYINNLCIIWGKVRRGSMIVILLILTDVDTRDAPISINLMAQLLSVQKNAPKLVDFFSKTLCSRRLRFVDKNIYTGLS